ncbi:MAG: VIT domain-containing protein, partial [Planctomycetota bacterium]
MKKKIFITSVVAALVAVSFIGYFVGCGQRAAQTAPSKVAAEKADREVKTFERSEEPPDDRHILTGDDGDSAAWAQVKEEIAAGTSIKDCQVTASEQERYKKGKPSYPRQWREAPRQSQSGLMPGDALVTERALHTFGTRLSVDSEENGKRVKRVAQRLPVELLNVTADEVWIIAKPETQVVAPDEDAPGSGAMLAKLAEEEKEIPLPLKHTDVQGQIIGYIATVEVTQQFHNPYDEKIEAVYVFPLPQNAAINEFIMTIGERRIRGIIRERKEAERIYRQARDQGYVASLLTQERPNIFTQKVANIEPGKEIDVNIKYFNTLAYVDGWYEFVFPMVVGPRFNPPGYT